MNRWVKLLGGPLLGVAILLGSATSATAGSPAQPAYGKAGRWITDAAGRAKVVNGFNIVNKFAPYTPEAIGFGSDDVAFLRRHGYDTVRLGLAWKGVEPKPGQYDEAYLAAIERTYDLLAKAGIAVLLDFHQDMYNERFQGNGFPDWAVLGAGAVLPAQPRAGFPSNYLLMPALQLTYDAFWRNEKGPDGRPIWSAYADAWVHVVKRFRDKPHLLGYNLFNEPFPGTRALECVSSPKGCPGFDIGALDAFNATVTAAIRRVDLTGLVWYAPWLIFDYGVTSAHRRLDDRAGFAFNAYCQNASGTNGGAVALIFPYYLRKSCREMADIEYGNGNAVAARNDEAVLNTEFGATDDLPLLKTYLESLERHMISWQQWAYWNADPSAPRPIEGIVHDPARAPAGDNVKQHKLLLSTRPRPAAVSGTPMRWHFEGKRFDLSYTTLTPGSKTERFKADSQTLVTIPKLQYPDGYRVTIRGARVVSRPGAQVLKLRSCAGAKTVELTVTPGRPARGAARCRKRAAGNFDRRGVRHAHG